MLDDAGRRPREEPHPAPSGGQRLWRTLRLGVLAGVAGAAVATVWILAADLWRGRPLETPATLCAHVTHAFGSSGWRHTRQLATLFTGLEIAVFVAAGVGAAAAARRRGGGVAARVAPPVVALAVVGLPLYALYLAAGPASAPGVWPHVVAAHVAAVAVVTALLRTAPAQRRALPNPAT